MRRLTPTLALILLGGAVTVMPQAAAAQAEPLAVGTMAPDFAIQGATRHGVLRDAVRLSDYRGKTVVLAFFFRARTRG
jgi:hypothetical protein